MALSKESVKKAWEILNDINPMANNSTIKKHATDHQLVQNKIIGFNKKEDGGWEEIFINIENISSDQLAKFERRKREISNTSFCKEHPHNITRLGWY